MKKLIAMILIAVMLAAAACTNAGPAEPEQTDAAEPLQTPAQEPAQSGEPSAQEPAEQDGSTMETDIYTFSIPEAWGDKFSYITGDNGIQFFSLSARNSDFDGLLCWIGTYPGMSAEQAKRLDETYYLGEKDGASYIMTYPVDVSTDTLKPDIAQEYLAMLDCLPDIVASFKMK